MAGFWTRVEAGLQRLVSDRVRMARWLRVGWWVSTAVTLVGVAVIFAVALGVWEP